MPLARLAMVRPLIRIDRGAGIAGLQTGIGALLSRPVTRLSSWRARALHRFSSALSRK
jgi:hypothetical protein